MAEPLTAIGTFASAAQILSSFLTASSQFIQLCRSYRSVSDRIEERVSRVKAIEVQICQLQRILENRDKENDPKIHEALQAVVNTCERINQKYLSLLPRPTSRKLSAFVHEQIHNQELIGLENSIHNHLATVQRILDFDRHPSSSANSNRRRASSATIVIPGSETYFPSPPPSPLSLNDGQFGTKVELVGQSTLNVGKGTFCATDTRQEEALRRAVQAGRQPVIEKILSSPTLDAALKPALEDATAIFASKFANKDVLKFIVQRIGPARLWKVVDGSGQGLIHNCVDRTSPNKDFVKWILGLSPLEAINKKDNNGWTPLRRALSRGKSASDVVELLLDKQADFRDNPPNGLRELHEYYQNNRRIRALAFRMNESTIPFRQ